MEVKKMEFISVGLIVLGILQFLILLVASIGMYWMAGPCCDVAANAIRARAWDISCISFGLMVIFSLLGCFIFPFMRGK